MSDRSPISQSSFIDRSGGIALRTAAGIPVLGAVIGPLSDKFDEAQQAAQEGEDAVADMLRVDNVEPADDEYFDDEGYDEEF